MYVKIPDFWCCIPGLFLKSNDPFIKWLYLKVSENCPYSSLTCSRNQS